MGGSSSSVSISNAQTYIDQNQLDILNKNITNQIANTRVNQAAKCGSDIVQNQAITISDIKTNGTYYSDFNQYQGSALDFSCIQSQQARNTIGNSLYQQMINNLSQHNSANIMAELEAQAAANIRNGFASWNINGGSNSDTNENIDWTVQNSTYQELQNVIENSIENNFTAENISNCDSLTANSQSITVTGVVAGEGVIMKGNQTQIADTYAQCLQNQNIAQEITTVMADATNVKVENTNSNSSTSTQYGTATSETINNGPFESLGNLFSSIFSGIGGLFSNFKTLSVICAILVVVIIVCLILSVLGYFLMSSKGLAPSPQELSSSAQNLGSLAVLAGGYLTESSLGMTAVPVSYSYNELFGS